MDVQQVLTSEKVEAIFMDCLFRDGEDTSNHIAVEGVVHNVGFHPERLESHRAEIEAMLDELPEMFHEKSGGGWSFLNACNDKHDNQWTDFHMRAGTAVPARRRHRPRQVPTSPRGLGDAPWRNALLRRDRQVSSTSPDEASSSRGLIFYAQLFVKLNLVLL